MGIDKVGATGELDRRLWVGKIFWSFVGDYKVSESESVSTWVEEEDVVPSMSTKYIYVFFFFDFFAVDDDAVTGVAGRESFFSAFCTSSIPRFCGTSTVQRVTIAKQQTNSFTFPLLALFALASSILFTSASFSIIPNNVLHRLCSSCGDLLLKNQSKRNTGNSVISFLIRSYTSSACIP